MRHLFVALLCIGWSFSTLATEVTFPYVAFVESHSASVLSGPGTEFYATERLKWGSKVEVYRHEEKWAAIRPSADSFSWVPADVTEDTANPRMVTVKQPDTFTRVGTQFSDKHSAEYVELKVGETLEVLGRKFMDDDQGNVIEWLKIAPPAGEFRWIRLNALSKTPPIAKATPKPPAKPKVVVLASEKEKPQPMASVSTDDDEPQPLKPSPIQTVDEPTKLVAEPTTEATEQIVAAGIAPVDESLMNSNEQEESAWQVVTYHDPVSEESAPQSTIGSGVRRIVEETPALARKLKDKLSGLTDLLSPPETRRFPEYATNTIQDQNVRPAQWFTEPVSPRPNLDAPKPQKTGWREVPEFSTPRVASLPPSKFPEAAIRPTQQSPVGMSPLPTPPPMKPLRSPAPHFASGDTNRYRQLPTIKSSLVNTPPNHDITPITPPMSPTVPKGRPPIVGIHDRNLLTQELTSIDLELAETVTRDPENWSLELLRIRAQAVIDASQIADIRDRGQRVLGKIAQFEDVQRRQRQMVYTSRADTMSSSAVLASLPRSATDSPESVLASSHFPDSQRMVQNQYPAQQLPGQTQVASGGPAARAINYDGEGWLMPVVTNRSGMPRYALTDENGQVKQFVSPQPGLNLSSYVRQRIGIFGQRSYLANVQKPHLTAERIVSMRQLR